MLCGVPASWLSKSMTNALLAGAVMVGVVNATPEATTLTCGAFASTEAAGAGDPDGAAKASDQQAGNGVAPGAGL